MLQIKGDCKSFTFFLGTPEFFCLKSHGVTPPVTSYPPIFKQIEFSYASLQLLLTVYGKRLVMHYKCILSTL